MLCSYLLFRFLSNYFSKSRQRIWFVANFLAVFFMITFTMLSPAIAVDDCISGVTLHHSWKQKFPFDLVYPISSSQSTPLGTTCPKWTMFGTEREICTPMQLTKILKNIFLLNISLKLLFF